MPYRLIAKKDFTDFLEKMARDFHLVGPVEKEPGQFTFAPLDDYSLLRMDYVHTILPPKKFFFPQRETLLRFDLSADQPTIVPVVERQPLALVGVHPCDLHGIQRLDMVFQDENPDPNYLEKRNAALIIGVNCMPDDQCFCASMGTIRPPDNSFDLFLTDIGEGYAVEIGSPKGQTALDAYARTVPIVDTAVKAVGEWYDKKAASQKIAVRTDVEHLPLLFGGEYHDGIWEELGQRCLSCGACNLVCPTCYCFDVQDHVDIASLKRGERERVWDGCQLEDFALVGSGENFREHRSDRNRHRFYRKFLYPVIRHKKTFCVACGRCVRSCLVHISVVDTVNHFAEKSPQGGAR